MSKLGLSTYQQKKSFKKKIKMFFRYRLSGFFNDIYWYVRWRTWDRYHIINMGLKPGYYDKDYLMLHACFNLLVQFIEREKGGPQKLLEERLEWKNELSESKKKLGNLEEDVIWTLYEIRIVEYKIKEIDELISLWDWWIDRSLRYHVDIVNQYEEDQAMLHRLITIRDYLWT
jgi:hypothetical protein